jgi:hypothetical protein
VASFPQWEYDLLSALGAPTSQNNLTALNLWALSEGNVTNNPLATSGRGVGAATCVAQCGSTSPVYVYDTEANGVAQMAKFLQGSYYTAIVRAFKTDAGLAAIFQAINSSPWCKGCQNGQYPVDLANAVGGSKATTDPTVGTGAGPGGSAAAAQGGAGQAPGSGLSACVFQAPGFLFFSGPCFLTKGGVKWLSGAAALVAGTAIGMFGVVLLASVGFKSSGAAAAVTKVAGVVPGPGKLLKAGGAVGAGRATSAPSPTPSRSPSAPAPAGRIESRQIERRYRETERQQGPIGPRGGNPTAGRVASRERRGRSVPGAGTRMSEAQRRQARASEPF